MERDHRQKGDRLVVQGVVDKALVNILVEGQQADDAGDDDPDQHDVPAPGQCAAPTRSVPVAQREGAGECRRNNADSQRQAPMQRRFERTEIASVDGLERHTQGKDAAEQHDETRRKVRPVGCISAVSIVCRLVGSRREDVEDCSRPAVSVWGPFGRAAARHRVSPRTGKAWR